MREQFPKKLAVQATWILKNKGSPILTMLCNQYHSQIGLLSEPFDISSQLKFLIGPDGVCGRSSIDLILSGRLGRSRNRTIEGVQTSTVPSATPVIGPLHFAAPKFPETLPWVLSSSLERLHFILIIFPNLTRQIKLLAHTEGICMGLFSAP